MLNKFILRHAFDKPRVTYQITATNREGWTPIVIKRVIHEDTQEVRINASVEEFLHHVKAGLDG